MASNARRTLKLLRNRKLLVVCLSVGTLRKLGEKSRDKISVTSPIVINMPTRELLASETKISFV